MDSTSLALGGMARITALLEALGSLSAPDDVCRAVGLGLLVGHHVRSVALTEFDLVVGALRLVGAHGVPDAARRSRAAIPVTARIPESDAVLSGRPLLLERAALHHEYPMLHQELALLPKDNWWTLCSPLRERGVPIGALSITFGVPLDWNHPCREYLRGAEAAVALWLSRHRTQAGSVVDSPPVVTQRQQRVLTLVQDGLSNGAIARQLGYSERTIKADLTALYRLLGATGRADLLRRAEQSGLLVDGAE